MVRIGLLIGLRTRVGYGSTTVVAVTVRAEVSVGVPVGKRVRNRVQERARVRICDLRVPRFERR